MKIRLGPIAIVIACIAVVAAFAVQGPQGIPGIQGIQGEKGSTGNTGPNGSRGPQGINGSQGPEGPRGFNGSMGPAGPIRGEWLNIGNLTSFSTKTFNFSSTPNSPIKVFWTVTSNPGNTTSSIIVKMIGSTSGYTAIWRETTLGPSETVKGVEVSLINPIETYTLTLSLKAGNMSSIRADVYRWITTEN